MIVKIERHPINFYFQTFFGSISILFIAILIIIRSNSKINLEEIKIDNYFLFPVSLFLIFISIKIIYIFYKNVPRIEINENKVKIRDEIIDFDDIVNVELSGKIPFHFFKIFPMEGLSIILKDGKIMYIYSDFYSNVHVLKQFLKNKQKI